MMNTLVSISAALAMAFPAGAQAQQDPVESRVQRLQQQLNLTPEQVAKAREIYKKQNDDVHAILTDDQKRQYDESSQRGGRGQQAGGRQGGARGGLPSNDELKTQLSLTDAQVAQIEPIRDGARNQIRDLFRNRQQGGNATEQMTRIREESNKKIRDLLTDEQKPKFDAIVTASQNNQGQPGAPGGQGGGRGGSLDERVARAMERLRVADAKEAEAIKGLVKKVMELMDKQDDARRGTRTKVDETSRNADLSEQAVGDLIAGLMKTQHEVEKQLASARQELMEVVTNRQELELLRQGILR